MKNPEPFIRNPKNPIITAKDLPYEANSVFNAGAALFKGRVLLLLRVEDRKGISHFLAARSEDGRTGWELDKKPTLLPDPKKYPEEGYGIEDPRITWLEELKKWAVVYSANGESGPLISMATTTDFKSFKKHGPLFFPVNKDAALFPCRFDGRWAMLHRPMIHPGEANIWISFSPELKYWGEHRVVIKRREKAWWDSAKIGLSAPPLLTEKGWLILYHGVKKYYPSSIYRLGLALLDKKDPSKLLARSKTWVLSPELLHERMGDVNNVVFSCGWVNKGPHVLMYYGCADTCLSVAETSVKDLLDWLGRNS